MFRLIRPGKKPLPGAAAKDMHRGRQGQPARDLAFGIMIAANDEDANPRLIGPRKLARKKAQREARPRSAAKSA